MTTKEELTFQVFQILTEYDLETFGQQQYTCEKIAEFIMQRDETQCTEVNNAHESAQKYMTAWQAAEDKVRELELYASDTDFDRNDMARQITEAIAERDKWLAAMQSYDPLTPNGYCRWCKGGLEHQPDCPRQAALAEAQP